MIRPPIRMPKRQQYPPTLSKRKDKIIPGHTLYAYNMLYMLRREDGQWGIHWGHTWGCIYSDDTLPKAIRYYLAKYGKKAHQDPNHMVITLSKDDFESLAKSDGYAMRREGVPDSIIDKVGAYHGY